jgi:hypothetical protein
MLHWVPHWSNALHRGKALSPNLLHCCSRVMMAAVIGGAILSKIMFVFGLCTANVKVKSVPVPLYSTTWRELSDIPQRGQSSSLGLPLKNARLPTPHNPVACEINHHFLTKGNRPMAAAQAFQLIKVTSSGSRLCFGCKYFFVRSEKANS